MSFRQAKSLMVGQDALEVDSHVTTRLLDFNEDGTIDLLTGNGKGELRAYLGKQSEDGINFQRATTIYAGSKLQWGNTYTGVVLAPIAGNERADLVVAHTSNKISIHPCQFKNREPVFSEEAIEFTCKIIVRDVSMWLTGMETDSTTLLQGHSMALSFGIPIPVPGNNLILEKDNHFMTFAELTIHSHESLTSTKMATWI